MNEYNRDIRNRKDKDSYFTVHLSHFQYDEMIIHVCCSYIFIFFIVNNDEIILIFIDLYFSERFFDKEKFF